MHWKQFREPGKWVRKCVRPLVGCALLFACGPLDGRLTQEWMGPFVSKNFRDVGKSLNSCLGKEMFHSSHLLRANKYFSGWPCHQVGNPEKIISLNFEPSKREINYCIQNNGIFVVGEHTNKDFTISDIEDLSRWHDPKFRQALCTAFRNTFDYLSAGKRVLVHCNAGRDRTGAFVAMLASAMAETHSLQQKEVSAAVECDYEKTKSLEANKRGKMKKLLESLQQQKGGTLAFFQKECGISKSQIASAAANFLAY